MKASLTDSLTDNDIVLVIGVIGLAGLDENSPVKYTIFYHLAITRPFPNDVNPIDIGIDITDVLRINDKVSQSM